MKAVPLKRLVTLIPGQSPPSADVSRSPEQELPFLQGNAEFGAHFPQPAKWCNAAPRRAARGDILLSIRAPVGALNVADRQYGIGRGLCAVQPVSVDPRFCWWLLHAARQSLVSMANGSTYDAVTAEDVGALMTPSWPPARQRAIADYLDAETARIDALIVKKRRMVELFEERAATEITSIFATDSGALTLGWRSVRARYICSDVTVGVVVDPSSYFVDEGVPFVHGTDVRRGWIDESAFKFLSSESNDSLRKSQLHAGDVIAMRVGEPGRAAVVPLHLDGANAASVLIFRKPAKLSSALLCAFLNSSAGRSQIGSMRYGAAQEVLNVAHALELRVPVPPLKHQALLVNHLFNIDDRTRKIGGLLQSQIALLQELRQALITAAVTGELAVPGAAA